MMDSEAKATRQTLDALLPNCDYCSLVERNEDSQFVHDEFRSYLMSLPAEELYEWLQTRDPAHFASVIRAFEEQRNSSAGQVLH